MTAGPACMARGLPAAARLHRLHRSGAEFRGLGGQPLQVRSPLVKGAKRNSHRAHVAQDLARLGCHCGILRAVGHRLVEIARGLLAITHLRVHLA
jgi:hypothetical protein